MGYLKVCAFSSLLLTSIVISVITVFQFTNFISVISYYNITQQNETLENEIEYWSETRWSALIDILLLSIFIIQHSFFISLLKNAMVLLQVNVLERCVFNLVSSITIQILMYYWIPIKGHTLWSVDVFENYSMWLLFNGFQFLGWIIIYIECLVMDITYLLGIKQIYYNLTGRPAPFTLRTPAFRDVSSKNTHSLPGFLMVFWFYPYMSLDRFLMAVILSLFLFIGMEMDDNAYNYIIDQDRRKRAEL